MEEKKRNQADDGTVKEKKNVEAEIKSIKKSLPLIDIKTDSSQTKSLVIIP